MSSGNLKKMKPDAGFGNVGAVSSEPATTLSPAVETPAPPSTIWVGLRPFEVWAMLAIVQGFRMASKTLSAT